MQLLFLFFPHSLPLLLLIFIWQITVVHFIVLVVVVRAAAAGTWPCPIGPSPTCPGYPRLACSPLSYSCPPPQCQSDAQCSPLRCQSARGLCEDYPEPKAAGTKCREHRECGMEMICVGGKCEEGARTGRTGSFRSCTKSIECPSLEDCEQGICLIRLPTNVIDESKPTSTLMPFGGTTMRPGIDEGGFQREDGLNIWSTGWCSLNGQCKGGHNGPLDGEECIRMGAAGQGQCFPRAFFNLQGQMIPPPPGHPHCRDANSPPSQHSTHCQQRKWLCHDGLYWELMGEQCARSCGRCEDLGVVDALLREGRVQTMIWAADNKEEMAGNFEFGRMGGMAFEKKRNRQIIEGNDDGKRMAKWKKKKFEGTNEEGNEMEMGLEMEGKDGCVDHWNSGECAKLGHLCANSAYRKQLARFCARTCRHF